MKLNLKKARKLETKILSAINERLSLSATVRVNADITDIEVKILNARKTAVDGIANKQALIDLRYKIRRLIAEANEQSGVSSLISDKVRLSAQKDLLNVYISEEVGLEKEELEDEINQKRKDLNKDGSFMRSKSALDSFDVLSKKDMDNFKNKRIDIIKEIEDIDDKLAELNYTTKITIDQSDIDLLTLNKLI